MSSQLVTLVPHAPLTDEVFPFNQEHFLDIREHQEKDLKFLSSEPVRAAVKVTGAVGGKATEITSGVSNVFKSGTSKVLGGVSHHTRMLPGSGKLLSKLEHGVLKGIDKTEHVAEHLVDPTRVVREHVSYSNDIKDNIPDAIKALDESVHGFSTEIGSRVQELYENIPTKGVEIITGLESRLLVICNATSTMYEILTKNNLEENLKIGKEKYFGVSLRGNMKNSLADIGEELPRVIKTIQDVKGNVYPRQIHVWNPFIEFSIMVGAFEAIQANLKLAKEKINSGITDPNQIFLEKHETVVAAWKAFEAKRRTMTYIPYIY
ncbi:hypothetical protein BYT27DRAFT_7262967 [Phlegmacium glaucopus]|nr:hypothetical protein BYT27DRAFT_7262967 [Phlegmacium glaucopus]